MAEKDFKSAVAYSKTVLPISMKNLVLADDEGLIFLGRENLQSILDEWAMAEKAFNVAIKSVERANRVYGQNRPTEFYCRQAKIAHDAQLKIAKLIKTAESKPLFCNRRKSPKDFKVGEKVFLSFAEDEADFFAECTVTGYRDNEVLVSVEAYDENGEETLDEGHVVFTSEYLYHAEDLKYLALHPEYFSLFVSFLLFEQEDAQILFDMIEDCVLYYYPETKDEILRLSKEMEAEFAADSTTSTNSPSNAT